MIGQYVQAVGASLEVVLGVLTRLALPLAILAGLALLAGGLSLLAQRESSPLLRIDWAQAGSRLLGVVVVGLVFVAGWSGLRAALPIARQDLAWREAAEATSNPMPDAPASYQYGPSVAAMKERTYTRTLNLPPDFLQRVGEQGVGVLAPYLSDPSAENVLRLADTFRRSGQDVVFTRSVTRLDEEPIPFTLSDVRVRFRRLEGRAYDAEFEGRYLFENSEPEAIDARFLFPLPQNGTLRDLNVNVAGQAVAEPNASGGYEWTGKLAPGERKEAVIRYRAQGARSWHYDLGSRRRRVQQFRLTVLPGGPARFLRGSLQPSHASDAELRWDLANVVTAQQVAIALPPEIQGRESYLQALSAMPASLALFVVGVIALGFAIRRAPPAWRMAAALGAFALGLGASVVIARYTGPAAAVILCPLVGAMVSARSIGPRSLAVAAPAALLPAAFLSPNHSGLLALLLAALAVVLFKAGSGRSVER